MTRRCLRIRHTYPGIMIAAKGHLLHQCNMCRATELYAGPRRRAIYSGTMPTVVLGAALYHNTMVIAVEELIYV